MKQEELNKVIEKHKHWLNRNCKDWQYMRADLSGMNLRGVNLSGVNLKNADT